MKIRELEEKVKILTSENKENKRLINLQAKVQDALAPQIKMLSAKIR